jgi:hypothetical protein
MGGIRHRKRPRLHNGKENVLVIFLNFIKTSTTSSQHKLTLKAQQGFTDRRYPSDEKRYMHAAGKVFNL